MAIIVTLGALAAFRLGSRIPVPGLDPATFSRIGDGSLPNAAVERLSIMALGVMPWFNAMLLMEMAAVVMASVRRWRMTPIGARGFERTVLLLGLAFAAVQAVGFASALQQVPKLVAEPGPYFLWPAAISIVTGAAVAFWLATLITRHGIGSGIWVLLAVPFVAGLPAQIEAQWELVQTGEISGAAATVPLAIAAASVAAVAILLWRHQAAGSSGFGETVWPVMLGSAAAGWVAVLPWLFLDHDVAQQASAALSLHRPAGLALLCVVIALFVWHFASRQPGASAPFAAVILVAVVAAPYVALAILDVPLLIDGRWIVVVVAILFSMAQPRPERQREAAAPES